MSLFVLQVDTIAMETPPVYNEDYLWSVSSSSWPSATLDGEGVLTFLLVALCLVWVLGVSGNGLVLWIAGREVKKRVSLIWVLNLAVADFSFTALLPFTIANQALGYHWPFGPTLCKLLSFTSQLNMFVSVFTLSVIAVDRCVSVTLPVWSQNHRTVKLATVVCAAVWILASVPSVPFLVLRQTVVDEEEGKTYCFYREDGDRLGQLVTARFVLAFLLPLATIAACYSIISVQVGRRWRRRSGRLPGRVVYLIVAAFFVCWLPFHLLYLLHVWAGTALPTALSLATGLTYANSCINPLLYVVVGRGPWARLITRLRTTLHSLHANTDSSGPKTETPDTRA
ncbi:C3a anaphylatoxin chemotactic receptor-like [Leucoraja erinacea]|uniref:C3a anaphylatoxin chemotactic receptor-like n=1 Tax=Leucoraja erinaceus TaxID=7782 RepID=UPI002456A700|nr:C3a anaphylatoxin chemotactic receptor-like [Leucoraja erinacea]